MKKLYLLLLLCASLVWANAAPAYPGLITVTQSDGTTVSFYLHGDEHFSYKTTEDGYLIAENTDGLLEYAYLADDNSFRTYGILAHNPLNRSVNEQNFVANLAKSDSLQPRLNTIRQQRKPAATTDRMNFPLKGSPRGLIILISYSDLDFTTPAKNFENLANQHDYSANGGTGSVRDYFTECSFGQFTPVFDVYGPYKLNHPRSYYGAVSGAQHDVRAHEMIVDACMAADGDVDYSKYDCDSNGVVDNVFVYYAGNNQAEGGPEESVWPHRSSVAYLNPPTVDGKHLADYACTSEYKYSSGKYMCGIGTFCHEFGHVLGLPDFYDTGYSDGLSAMGRWDIMTSGNYNNDGCTPPTYTAYERFYLGWLKPIPLTNDSTVDCEGSYSLKSLISSNTAYLISKTQHNLVGAGPNPKEFFMLEYRLMEGRDTHTGLGEGMLITHINYNSTTWQNNGPNNDRTCLGYYPVLPNRPQAYGSSSDLYPNVDDHCSFTLYGEDEPMLRQVVNIDRSDTAMLFDYIAPNESLILTVKDIEANLAPKVETFVVSGTKINETLNVSIRDNREFQMRRHTSDGSETYRQSITLTPDSNGVLFDTIDVKYTPLSVTYDNYSENRFTVRGSVSSSLTKIAKFRYRNRRPVYVTAPEAYEATDIDGTSAKLSWSFVADTASDVPNLKSYGAKYYLDVYSMSDQPQVETESFESFPDSYADDWSINFDTYSDSRRKTGQRSAIFKTMDDTIYTKEYMSDIENFSLWISSITSEGTFFIDAQYYETGEWRNVQTMIISPTTTQDIEINKLRSGYRRLRFYYLSLSGTLAIDDISVQTANSIFYAAKNEYLRDTTYTVNGLTLGQEYRFKVRATDRDEKKAEPRYENVTEFSNEVVFKTNGTNPQPEDGKPLTISVVQLDGTNYYQAYVSEVKGDEYKLFVYNLDGVLVATLDVPTNTVTLPQMPVGQYILKYTKATKGSKSDPVTKFNYNLK